MVLNIVISLCVFFSTGLVFAEGTHTASGVKNALSKADYENINNIVIDYETQSLREGQKMIFRIINPVDGKEYKITEQEEMILFLLDLLRSYSQKLESKQ